MTTHATWLCKPRTERAQALVPKRSLPTAVPLIPMDLVLDDNTPYIRLHALSEGTITLTNGASGAADTVLTDYASNVASAAEKDMFNATLDNQDLSQEVLMGFILMYDITQQADNTDKDIFYIDVHLFHSKGGVVTTQDRDQISDLVHELAVYPTVHGGLAAGEDDRYSPPMILPLSVPRIINKNEGTIHYIGATTIGHRDAFEAVSIASNALTIKVAPYAILVDVRGLERFADINDFWEFFLGR